MVAAGAAGLADLGLIMLVILALLAILFVSYWQTIKAYPISGGAYTVAKENLGVNASLLASAGIMVDYVLLLPSDYRVRRGQDAPHACPQSELECVC